jgi:hypothetical protein
MLLNLAVLLNFMPVDYQKVLFANQLPIRGAQNMLVVLQRNARAVAMALDTLELIAIMDTGATG